MWLNVLNDNKSKSFTELQMFTLSVIISLVLLFVYSKNSIIYPINDYVDENIFFSVTDAMFHGKILYKEIFEHKGPFQYLVVYNLAHILGNSYFTIYLFECIANALFVYFSTKIILLYDSKATKFNIFIYMLCLEFCLCTSATFMFGGVPEELFLWMSSYGLYVTLRCLKQDQYYSSKEIVWIGIICGAIFWTKYAMLGFYSGLVLYVLGWNIAQKKLARLGKTVLLFLGGFGISTLPTIIYCTITQSFTDMIDVYFIGNIFGEHQVLSRTANCYALFFVIFKDVIIFLFIISGLCFAIKSSRLNQKVLFITTALTSFLASCCLKTFFYYYPMPMLIFLPLGIIAFNNIKSNSVSKIIKIAVAVILIHIPASQEVGLRSIVVSNSINPNWVTEEVRIAVKSIIPLLLLFLSKNQNCLKISRNKIISAITALVVCTLVGFKLHDPSYFKESPLPQTRFAKIIKQIPQARILVYRMYDVGFNKISQTYPQIKYFTNLNLVDPKYMTDVRSYIKYEMIDFIITTPIGLDDLKDVMKDSSYILLDIAEPYYYHEGTIIFYLYGKQPEYKE